MFNSNCGTYPEQSNCYGIIHEKENMKYISGAHRYQLSNSSFERVVFPQFSRPCKQSVRKYFKCPFTRANPSGIVTFVFL